jgi:hypothetical protein
MQEMPSKTNAYLVNGPQKSARQNYRILETYPFSGFNSSTEIDAQFYDSRFDSIFMVKAMLYDEQNNPYEGFENSAVFSASLMRIRQFGDKLLKDD